MSRWRSGRVAVRGGALAYHRTGGDGRPLVLSHGLTDNGLCWSRFAAEMARDFDVIMLDARGHGESARIAADAPHDAASDLAAAIEALGLAAPIVMGHSVGARATAVFASAHPDRASRVVLEDPAFVPLVSGDRLAVRRASFRKQVEAFGSMTDAELLAKGRADAPGWSDQDFPAWVAAKRQVDPEAFPTYLAPWQAEIGGIQAPTLLVHGEPRLGSLMTPEVLEDVRAHVPQVETALIRGAGHNVRRENFDDYLAAVRAFLLD